MASKIVTAIAAIVAVIIIVFAAYAGLTYPRTIVTIPVSFTVGTDVTKRSLTNRV